MEDFKVVSAAIDKAFKSGVFNTQEAAQVIQAMSKVAMSLEQAENSQEGDEPKAPTMKKK